jgi:hypothetical protein
VRLAILTVLAYIEQGDFSAIVKPALEIARANARRRRGGNRCFVHLSRFPFQRRV